MKRKLEIAANVTVIVVALVVGGVVLDRHIENAHTPNMVAVGDHLPATAGVDWSQHQHTLVLALNTGCHFCQDSLPFYQKLEQALRPGADDLDMVALYPNDAEAVRRFNTEGSLKIRTVAAAPFDKLHIAGTPTLMLVDAQGRVERTWVGLLSPRQELELLATISGNQINLKGE